MNELKFNSQICTTKEQSKRLLDLGLKSETADMRYYCLVCNEYPKYILMFGNRKTPLDIPAWSLHRLIEILPSEIKQINCYYSLIFDKDTIQYEDYDVNVLKSFEDSTNFYDNIIDCIEWLISEGYFNKEYLSNEKQRILYRRVMSIEDNMKQITDSVSQLVKEESSAINPILPQDNIFVSKGWQCPICGRVYSPTTPMCFYCGNEINTTALQTRGYTE